MDATTARLARYATELSFGDLTPAALHETKRRLIDTFGCAVAGFDSEPSVIARRLAAARTGTPSARVLGTTIQSTVEMAAFATSVQVRYLDANDTYISPINGTGHPSDMTGGLLAVAEANGKSWPDLLLATALAYEVFGALADVVALRARGWDQGLYGVLGVAAGVGKLLGLSFEQMGNALAIAVSANVPTRQNRAGELAMWKGCATPAATSAGVFAALLAAEGVTGPTEAFEGRHGVWEQVTGSFAIGTLGGENGHDFMIERASVKFLPVEFHSQVPLTLALRLREQVPVDQIAELTVYTYQMAYSEIGSEPAKWDPRTRETADHSLPYLLATALRDGGITTTSFDLDRVLDPTLRPLMNRIRVIERDDLSARFPAELPNELELVTTSGVRLVETGSYPKGHVQNPLSDADLETKFRMFVEPALGVSRATAALDALWHIDTAPTLGPVLDRFVRSGA